MSTPVEHRYHCRVFDRAGQMCCDRLIHAFNDRIAIERAGLFLRDFQCGAGVHMELWLDNNLVHTDKLAEAPRSTPVDRPDAKPTCCAKA